MVNAIIPAAMSAGAGAGIFSGIIAAAGFAISLLKTFLAKDPEPLRLAIELGIRGEIKGVVQATLQEATSWFYLPGRFSVEEAFDPSGTDGLSQDNIPFIDSILPRYQRTLGLFGYKYHPGNIQLTADMLNHQRVAFPVNRQWVTPMTCIKFYGAIHPTKCKGLGNTIERLLPIIRNEYGPNMFVLPTSKYYKAKGFSSAYVKVFYDTSHLQYDCGACVWPPYVDLPEGVTLVVSKWYAPQTFSSFTDAHDAPVEYGNDPEIMYGTKSYPAWWSMLNWYADEKEKDDPDIHPLHDILFYWNISYLIWDRQQNLHTLDTQMCAPISLDLKNFVFDPNNKLNEVEHAVRESLLLR